MRVDKFVTKKMKKILLVLPILFFSCQSDFEESSSKTPIMDEGEILYVDECDGITFDIDEKGRMINVRPYKYP